MEKLYNLNKICHFKDTSPKTIKLKASLYLLSFTIKESFIMISSKDKAKFIITIKILLIKEILKMDYFKVKVHWKKLAKLHILAILNKGFIMEKELL